jgi:transcriptional regulator with XRE-family HTH domain
VGSAEPSNFGDLLRSYRTASGLTQDQLAERAGLSARGVQDLERGLRRTPYATTVRRVAAALELDEAQRAARTTALNWAGVLEYFYGNLEQDRVLLEEAVVIAQGSSDARETAQTLLAQSIVARRAGELTTAHRLADEAIAMARGAGDPFTAAAALREAGQVAASLGDLIQARAALEEALALGFGFPTVMGLARLAGLKAAAGAMCSAARLFAACHIAEVQSERWWGPPPNVRARSRSPPGASR